MHDITIIVTFDCRGNYSGCQQKLAKREVLNKLERLHLQQVLSCKSLAECFTEKKKKKQSRKKETTFSSSCGVWLQKRQSKSRWYATTRSWYTTKKKV